MSISPTRRIARMIAGDASQRIPPPVSLPGRPAPPPPAAPAPSGKRGKANGASDCAHSADDPLELDGETYTTKDVLWTLQNLPWNGHRFMTLRIDKEVALFLANALRRR
jgi:hypothetical protein